MTEKVNCATQLVELGENEYTWGVTPEGEPYALPKEKPRVVRLLRGGRQSLRAELSKAYYASTGSAASQSALADALMVIEGKANAIVPVPLHLRVAQHGDKLVMDLGDATGRCVVLTAFGWTVEDESPVRFRRTALTGALPSPARDASDFTPLWNTLNVAKRYRPLVLAVLVSALMPSIPHPVVMLTGEQGTGKSTATARLASIVDPSPAQLRKAPRDVESWTTAAAGSWVVPLDNLSGIPEWLSDAVCRASTGDGDVRRRLYTDGDLHVIAFRRCVLLNGIDVGALRGDLADRVVHLQLEPIAASTRKLDEQMAEQWREDHPKVLGALLDLTVKVLNVLPGITLAEMPRMADFARVLAAVDRVNGTDGLKTYLGLRTELAQDAATSDPVLINLQKEITLEWSGTSADLLETITPSLDDNGYTWKPPKGWPESARQMTTAMARQAPTLRQLGWSVTKLDKSADPRGKAIGWQLIPPPAGAKVDNDGRDEQREYENNTDDAATRQNGTSSQVNGHVLGAASGAASAGTSCRDAAAEADPEERGTIAAHDAAPSAPPLSRQNGVIAASAAKPAPDPYLLCSTTEDRPKNVWRNTGKAVAS